MKKIVVKKWRSYREFLDSEDWQKMRNKVMARDKHTCQICGAKATEVHHKAYTTRRYHLENLDNLIAICRKCHENIHKKGKARKERELQELLKKIPERKIDPDSIQGDLLSIIMRKLDEVLQQINELSETDKQKIAFLKNVKLENKEGIWFDVNKYLDQTLQKINNN